MGAFMGMGTWDSTASNSTADPYWWSTTSTAYAQPDPDPLNRAYRRSLAHGRPLIRGTMEKSGLLLRTWSARSHSYRQSLRPPLKLTHPQYH